VSKTVASTAEKVQAAPGKAANKANRKFRDAVETVTGRAQSQLDAAKREIDARKGD
jgi:hypothetical protein